jgi:murein DD-endopeptidase MepM/ murein hydrolase activator NlpD
VTRSWVCLSVLCAVAGLSLALSANAPVAAGGCDTHQDIAAVAARHGGGAPVEPPFICPAQGVRVVSCWTRRDDEIVLAVSPGASIRATGAGVVSFAGELGAHGRVIFIRHAQGFVSAYARLGALEVKRGDRVAPGQRIATMARENGAPGAELIFELVRAGKPVAQGRYVACR